MSGLKEYNPNGGLSEFLRNSASRATTSTPASSATKSLLKISKGLSVMKQTALFIMVRLSGLDNSRH